jgi:hypothetical protein
MGIFLAQKHNLRKQPGAIELLEYRSYGEKIWINLLKNLELIQRLYITTVSI